MSVQEYLEKMKKIQNLLLEFIEVEDNDEENYQNLIKLFNDDQIQKNRYDLKSILRLILNISNNHNRGSNFFEKIEKIMNHFKEEIKNFYSNSEIFNLFKSNKRILLFLINEKLLIIDEQIAKEMCSDKYKKAKYDEYFAPELKPFIKKEIQYMPFQSDYETINQYTPQPMPYMPFQVPNYYGMPPQMNQLLVPQMNQRMVYPMNQGFAPQMNQGMQPLLNQGMVPQMNRGLQPLLNQGMVPQMNQGMQPLLNQGMIPQMNRGMQPLLNQGMVPQMNRGMQPLLNQGMVPQMNQGMLYPMNQRMIYPMNQGFVPPMNQRMQPLLNQIAVPQINQTNVIQDNQRITAQNNQEANSQNNQEGNTKNNQQVNNQANQETNSQASQLDDTQNKHEENNQEENSQKNQEANLQTNQEDNAQNNQQENNQANQEVNSQTKQLDNAQNNQEVNYQKNQENNTQNSQDANSQPNQEENGNNNQEETPQSDQKDKNSPIDKKDQEIPKVPDIFEEKRRIGENDDPVCKMIRKDQIEEFITFVNKNGLDLKSCIKSSIFETNIFLLPKQNDESKYMNLYSWLSSDRPTYIQYAAFFGSIQIFNYLYKNGVELTSTLWMYAIHGQNPELIRVLEENDIKPTNNTYKKCFLESIKCHHNGIADYIDYKYLQTEEEDSSKTILDSLKYYNFAYIPNNLKQSAILELCKYDYYTLFDILAKYIDVNHRIVFC